MTADREPCNESLKDQESHIRAQKEGWDLHCAWLRGMLSGGSSSSLRMRADDPLFAS